MICKEILPDIFHINFFTQKNLTTTFLRFQEHFESPHFKDKIFTLDEFKDWYIKNSPQGIKTNLFTYYSDWSGFNIPSEVLIPFQKGLFNPLSDKEIYLLNLFQNKSHPFYIIGTYGKNQSSLIHEIAHGLFYTNINYKNEVLEVLNSISDKDKQIIFDHLKKSGGYHKSVFIDELHAYILDGLDKLEKKGLVILNLRKYQKELKSIFNIYSLKFSI